MTGVREDGLLSDNIYCGNCFRSQDSSLSDRLSGFLVPFHGECTKIIRKAHQYLPHFPVISWDFAQREDGVPVLIEYNLKWHSALHFQVCNGPLFGDLTDQVLEDAAVRARNSRSLFYR